MYKFICSIFSECTHKLTFPYCSLLSCRVYVDVPVLPFLFLICFVFPIPSYFLGVYYLHESDSLTQFSGAIQGSRSSFLSFEETRARAFISVEFVFSGFCFRFFSLLLLNVTTLLIV